MVAALSPSSPKSVGQEQNDRPVSSAALAEKGNEVARKQRSREITSRYKSATTTGTPTPTTPSSARRYPSPLIGRSSNASSDGPKRALTNISEGPKRAISAERKRPDSSSSSASSSGSSSKPTTPRRTSLGNADGLRSSQRLWPSTHNLSSSVQLDHTLKPAENGIRRASSYEPSSGKASDRKGTPERKRTPVRRAATDQTENARPSENAGVKPDVHRWPAASSPKALSRSVDLTSDKESKSGKVTGLMVQGRALNATPRTPAARLRNLSIPSGSPSPSPPGISPRSASNSQPPSPSRMMVSSSSPFRSMPSPTRTRISSFQLPPSGHSRTSSFSSLLHFPLDVRKGKKAMSQQEEAHYLRILHNRWLQWRFVNARAEGARNTQKVIGERSIFNAWLQTSELRKSVAMKRIKLQQARQAMKLQSVLSSQGPELETWAALQQEHALALTGAMEALEAAVIRVPVTSGARADVQAIRDAMAAAVDVMGSVDSSVGTLVNKTEKVDGLVSELAEVTKQEKTVLEDCSFLLDRIAALEIEERSLRTHFMQLECEKSRNPRRLDSLVLKTPS